MGTVVVKSEQSSLRLRAGIGFAGMFVVACFGAAMFFSGSFSDNQAQAADLAADNTQTMQIVQVAETK